MQDPIESTVIEIVAAELGLRADKVTRCYRIDDEMEKDSDDAISFINALEEQFDLDITDQEAHAFKEVSTVVDFVRANAPKYILREFGVNQPTEAA